MIRKYLSLLALLFSSYSIIHGQSKPNLYNSVSERAMNRWVDSVFDAMSLDERIGQLFMIVAEPSTKQANIDKLTALVKNQKIGGILFSRGEPVSQAKVTNRLQSEANVPLFIALDGEWGLSMRLSNTTRFPKNMMLGAVSDLEMIERYGEEVGRQCREMGIHINFAPVLDVNSNPKNPVIGIRSFGEDHKDVTRKSLAFSRGLEKAGIISVAKHFPGHGDTNTDSHVALPTVDHELKRLHKIELYPFINYIKEGYSGIMTAHLNVPALGTKGRPCSLSHEVVTDLLQNELDFNGLCFTDGLAMKGVAVGTNESVCVLALKAGNHILCGPVEPEKEFEAVKLAIKNKQLKISDIENKCRKVLKYKYIAGLNHYRPIDTKSLPDKLETPVSAFINATLNSEAITVVKNNKDIIPLKNLDKQRIAALSIGGLDNNIFHSTLRKYAKIDCFNIALKADINQVKSAFEKLKDYDLVICSIHNVGAIENDYLKTLAARNNLISVFFTVPYKCTEFKESSAKAQAVIIAYETTDNAESYAAQAIFGGIAAKGNLPVEIPGMYAVGTGIETAKTRLGYGTPETVGMDSYKLAAIDTIVLEGIDNEAYPGCQVLVAKDGMIIYDKSFGYYDFTKKRKVTGQTVYDLASVSKATGTLLALMKSYDDGNYDLTDKISEYVTEFKKSDKQDIKIIDMLYHQSGLPATINFFEQAIDKGSYTGSLYSRRKDNLHTVRYDAKTWANANFKYNPDDISRREKKGFDSEVARNMFVCDAFPKDSIISGIIKSTMGTKGRYTYSCINFISLKLMVERQTRQAMDKFLERNFFDRLGVTSLTYNPLHKMDTALIAPTENDRFVRKQVIRGYVHDEAAAFQGGVSGNAGLFSNATDLAKISQLYLNGGIYGGERYISAKTCRLFTSSRNTTSRRGLGFDKPDIRNTSSSPCGKLTPKEVYGHTGFTGTCFWIDPVNNLIYIFLSNRTFPTRTNSKLFTLGIRTRIQDAIYEAITNL